LEFTNNTSYIIALVGGLTAFFAATIGTMQNDIKRIIAYSTCSQLGYMVFACGFHNYNVSFFHLFNHAFFKALLFLTAGAIIHSLNDEQDIRKMGGLFKLLPFSYISFFIGSLALTGFPFLTGFYSKDFLLELTLTNFSNLNLFIYWLSCTAACCTAFYSFRLIFFVFFNKTQNYKKIIENIHENGIKINICLFLLMLCSIFVGFIFKDLIIGVGSIFWTNVLIINPFNNNLYNSEFLETYYKLLPLIISFFGIFICFLIYNIKINLYLCKLFLNHKNLRFLYFFINKRWFFDLIYNFIINYFYKISFNIFFIKIDRGFLELLGPLGLTRIIYSLSINYTNYFQNGLFKYYLKIYLIFILIFFNIFFINNNNLFIFNFLNFFEIFIFIFIIENLIDKSKYKL
jgi:NADH-ubiquinone oxidoreductase chain 5